MELTDNFNRLFGDDIKNNVEPIFKQLSHSTEVKCLLQEQPWTKPR